MLVFVRVFLGVLMGAVGGEWGGDIGDCEYDLGVDAVNFCGVREVTGQNISSIDNGILFRVGGFAGTF